jgi:HEAT repeat protein
MTTWKGLLILLLALASNAYSQKSSPASNQDQGSAGNNEFHSVEERRAEFNKKSPEELGEELEKNPEQIAVIHRLRVLGDKSSVAHLHHAYQNAKTPNVRLAAAAAIVSLGERNGEAWIAVSSAAQTALNESAPYPMGTDEKGAVIYKKYSNEFLAWCKKAGENPDAVAERMLHAEPQAFTFIGYTGDPRAMPPLLEGLRSKNPQIVIISSQLLARLQYKPAVPLIIDAAKRIPKGLELGLGYALACFDDPKAQEIFPQFVKNEKAVQELRQKFHDKNCFLLVGE